METWYNDGIHITAVQGIKWADAKPITEKQYAKLFVDFIVKQLDLLKSVPLGKELLKEIKHSGHHVSIFFDNTNAGHATWPKNHDAHNEVQRFFKAFRPVSTDSKKKWLIKNLGANPFKALFRSKDSYSNELQDVIARSPYTPAQVARLVGVSDQEFAKILDGSSPMNDDVYIRISLYLYEWLSRGQGCDCVIRYNAGTKFSCCESGRADWKNEVAFISLGHELIHAWRMMTGRRIFTNGVGEEHMTTGLPPYTSMKFTENKLRVQANLAIRDYYNAFGGEALGQNLGMRWQARIEDKAKFWAASVKALETV